MSARLLLATLAALLCAAAPAGAVAPISLDLRGTERDHVLPSGDERELIRATGDGASLVLHERVECGLKGANCGQLHRGVAHGDCMESLVRGELRTRRGTLRLRGVGLVCAGRHDRERLWLLGHRGTGRLAGVHAVLEVRIAKTVTGGGAGSADTVSVDTIGLETLGIDRDRRARAAAPGDASQACIVCELLVGVVHGGQQQGHLGMDVHFSNMARTCVQMPDPWSRTCEDVVEQHGPAIVRHALQLYDAEAICVTLLRL